MRRFDYYDFELAELDADDEPVQAALVSMINTEALKALITRQNLLSKRLIELERRLEK